MLHPPAAPLFQPPVADNFGEPLGFQQQLDVALNDLRDVIQADEGVPEEVIIDITSGVVSFVVKKNVKIWKI